MNLFVFSDSVVFVWGGFNPPPSLRALGRVGRGLGGSAWGMLLLSHRRSQSCAARPPGWCMWPLSTEAHAPQCQQDPG